MAFTQKPTFLTSDEALAILFDSDAETLDQLSSGDEYRPTDEDSSDSNTNDVDRLIRSLSQSSKSSSVRPQTDVSGPLSNEAPVLTVPFQDNEPVESVTGQSDHGNHDVVVRGRKRFRNEENWLQNIRKRARNHGQEYINRKNNKVEKRKLLYHRCGRCVNRCNEVLTDDARDNVFKNYWQMGDWQRQRDFIASHVKSKPIKRPTKVDSKRKRTLQYYFTVDGIKVKVCKAVFLKTLGIKEKTVTYTLDRRSSTGQACPDKRGKCTPANKLPEDVRAAVREHIASFPCMESHYVRSKSTKKYLEQNLTVRQMFELYGHKYASDPSKQVKLKYYRDVFNTDFNLSFHRPKKDLCNYCFTYNNLSENEKKTQLDDYNDHHNRKNRVRDLKAFHKNLAKENEDVMAATFDLEQVLLCPKLNVSSLFYRRKLSTYNLTVYNLANHDVTCFMWHEGNAGRGSCEIGSCVYNFIKCINKDIKRVILYSDTCSGQNRNQFFSAMCLHAVENLHVDCIDHIFMESGHSQMECDSAHSTIESAIRKKDVFCPTDYYTIAGFARRNKPYDIKIMNTEDILDFKAYSKGIIRNRNKDMDGSIVQWLKIKWMRYLKGNPNKIYFRYDYDMDFKVLRVNMNLRTDVQPVILKPLFAEAPCISKAKYDDLLFLCNSLAIPRPYHYFYKELKYDGKIVDTLTEPDITEADVDVLVGDEQD